ncbi:hypothetical protein [Mycolicibacterium goodii]|uniref:Lipoprotein n=1 Tax=Mycolicibacterium goodii TaxID=134601 RepID=A0A0K0XA70_MYCGD|nr:hypothetical protein AFA91_23035 [Mycolicibacterium goodii]
MKFSRLTVLIVVVIAATACGAHGGAAPTTATPQPATGDAATAADPADYTALSGGVYFLTPSRNIACGLAPGNTGCQVFHSTAIPPGADCDHRTMPRDELAKGYYVDDRGGITPSCFNQGNYNVSADQKVLPYGRSLAAGGTLCVSRADGVTCTRGEHGFFVSAQGFRQW